MHILHYLTTVLVKKKPTCFYAQDNWNLESFTTFVYNVRIFCIFIIPSPYFDEIRNICTLKHNLNQIFIHIYILIVFFFNKIVPLNYLRINLHYLVRKLFQTKIMMICKRELGFMQTIDRELSLEYKK